MGLTLAVAADPALTRDVEELAQAICRDFFRQARRRGPGHNGGRASLA